jgi:hypothetical protein
VVSAGYVHVAWKLPIVIIPRVSHEEANANDCSMPNLRAEG